MSFLVDTNVFSEGTRPRPDSQVQAWLAAHEAELYISALTIGELRCGIERLRAGSRRDALQAWLSRICDLMEGRILSISPSVAHTWGQMRARWATSGISLPAIDGLIAATARRYGLVLVTRNQRDFARSGVKTLNPFSTTVRE